MNIIRFEKRNEPKGKPKGYSETFYVYGEDNRFQYCCDVFGWGEKAPTRFLNSKEASTADFTMHAKRKFMNNMFYLTKGEDGDRLCTITRKGSGTLWKIIDTGDKELCNFIDPAGFSEVFFRNLLVGSPDRYALMRDKELIGRIRRQPRPNQKEGRGWVKLINKVLSPIDWILELVPQEHDTMDERFLVAGMILLQIQDIPTSRAKSWS